MITVTLRPLYHRERPSTPCVGGWVGPGTGLDGYEKSRHPGIRSPGRPDHTEQLHRLYYPRQAAVYIGFHYFTLSLSLSLSPFLSISKCYRYSGGSGSGRLHQGLTWFASVSVKLNSTKRISKFPLTNQRYEIQQDPSQCTDSQHLSTQPSLFANQVSHCSEE